MDHPTGQQPPTSGVSFYLFVYPFLWYLNWGQYLQVVVYIQGILYIFLLFVGSYNATPATPQGYTQPVQGYGGSSYDSSTAAASSTSSNQAAL